MINVMYRTFNISEKSTVVLFNDRFHTLDIKLASPIRPINRVKSTILENIKEVINNG